VGQLFGLKMEGRSLKDIRNKDRKGSDERNLPNDLYSSVT
jgi:hypothetical protein